MFIRELKTAVLGLIVIVYPLAARAQNAASPQTAPSTQPWQDPSPHRVQFIAVDAKENVSLEVLDWGGTGRAVVLLAGLGNTAHVFDDFAPKLTGWYHVYGITRRGFGASSSPVPHDDNYSADRLGDDVIAVLDALKLERPVLAGHSIAGEELSSIGSRRPERVAGLIYLDAGYSYAYYNPELGDFRLDLADVRSKVDQFHTGTKVDEQRQRADSLLELLPRFEQDLQKFRRGLDNPEIRGPMPTPVDLANVPAYRSWLTSNFAYAVPDAEVRQLYQVAPSGEVGKPQDRQAADRAIIDGEQKYASFKIPIQAIYVLGHLLGPFADKNPVASDFSARDEANGEAAAAGFERAFPSARVVRFHRTYHYLFITNETDVLREIRAFIATLP